MRSRLFRRIRTFPVTNRFTTPDVPTVYQLPGDSNWYMSFIAFNGGGYNSFVAQSTDLSELVESEIGDGVRQFRRV